jgi:hypothetical protein
VQTVILLYTELRTLGAQLVPIPNKDFLPKTEVGEAERQLARFGDCGYKFRARNCQSATPKAATV